MKLRFICARVAELAKYDTFLPKFDTEARRRKLEGKRGVTMSISPLAFSVGVEPRGTGEVGVIVKTGSHACVKEKNWEGGVPKPHVPLLLLSPRHRLALFSPLTLTCNEKTALKR